MKKRNLILMIGLLVVILAAGCHYPKPGFELGDSQTQVALFAQATLTKFASMTEPTQEPSQETEPPTQADPTLIPSVEPATEEVVVPTATEVPVVTVIPVTPVAPTATSGPLPTAPTGVTRVNFATGTTNHTVSETIPANTTKRYALRLSQWQMIEIVLKSSTTAHIAVSTEKGDQLVDFSKKWTWYRDYATENGDWYVDVRTGNYAADINLNLTVPQRISFESGKDTLVAKASLGGSRTHNFIAWANKDQTMSISLNPSSGLVLSIWHVGGDVLLESSAGKTSFEGKLPKAGDYVTNVSNQTGSNIDFELNFSVK